MSVTVSSTANCVATIAMYRLFTITTLVSQASCFNCVAMEMSGKYFCTLPEC